MAIERWRLLHGGTEIEDKEETARRMVDSMAVAESAKIDPET